MRERGDSLFRSVARRVGSGGRIPRDRRGHGDRGRGSLPDRHRDADDVESGTVRAGDSGANWTASTTVNVYVDGVNICNPTVERDGHHRPGGVRGSERAGRRGDIDGHSRASLSCTHDADDHAGHHVPPVQLSSARATPFTLNAGGFAGGSGIKAYLDSTSSTALATSPASPTTDSSGTINSLSVTIPVVGHGWRPLTHPPGRELQQGHEEHHRRPSDASPSDRPRESPPLTSRSPGRAGGPTTPSRSTWAAPTSAASPQPADGTLSSVCTVPGLPAGVHTLTAQQDSNSITATRGLVHDQARGDLLPEPGCEPECHAFVSTRKGWRPTRP